MDKRVQSLEKRITELEDYIQTRLCKDVAEYVVGHTGIELAIYSNRPPEVVPLTFRTPEAQLVQL
jgi:hypothetical protein